jgi:hypothetical protein
MSAMLTTVPPVRDRPGDVAIRLLIPGTLATIAFTLAG